MVTHEPILSTVLSDTDEPARLRYLTLLADMPAAERLMRTLELSAFVREIAWVGARQAVAAGADDTVRNRFLEQLYGSNMSDNLRALITRL